MQKLEIINRSLYGVHEIKDMVDGYPASMYITLLFFFAINQTMYSLLLSFLFYEENQIVQNNKEYKFIFFIPPMNIKFIHKECRYEREFIIEKQSPVQVSHHWLNVRTPYHVGLNH